MNRGPDIPYLVYFMSLLLYAIQSTAPSNEAVHMMNWIRCRYWRIFKVLGFDIRLFIWQCFGL